MGKQHKYNVGDEIVVKIAAVTEVNGKPAYRIKGIENIKFSKGGINAMSQKKIKPDDVIYMIERDDATGVVLFDAIIVADIGTKEIKLSNEWFAIEKLTIFSAKEEAEKYVEQLSHRTGYSIVRGGLFREEM